MSLRAFRLAWLGATALCSAPALALDEAPAMSDPSADVTPPRLLDAAPARMPDGQAPPVDVAVTLVLTIDETGRVSESRVIESGDVSFDESALEAVSRFQFEPARRGERAMAAQIRYRYVFAALSAPPPEVPPELARPTPASLPSAGPVAVEPLAPSAPASVASEFSGVATVSAPPREPTRYRVSGEVLTEVPGTRGDALRSIEIMPGVGRTSLSNGDPILRGAGQDESQTYLNGVPVPFLYHFGGLTSFFNSRYIERVDLYPGNFSTRYGRVAGGVVEVRSKDPARDGLHAGLELSLIDSSAFMSAPVGDKASFALSARRSNIDLVFSKLVPKNTYSVVAAPVYYDYQALGAYHFNAQHTLRLTVYGSRDSLRLSFSHPNDEDPALSGKISGMLAFHRVQVELDSRLGDSARQTLSLTLGRLDATQHFGELEQTLSGTELHGRNEWRVELRPELSVTAGVDFYGQFLGGRYRGPAPGQFEGNPSDDDPLSSRRSVSTVQPSFDVVRPGAYLELGVRATPRLLLLPGLRADYYADVGHASFDPRLTARYRISDGLTIKSGLGFYTQAPQYWQALAVIGNPQVEPSRALQSSLGFELQASERLKLSAEGFYKRLTHRIVGTPGNAAPHWVNDGEGRIFGAELLAEYRPTAGTFGYLAYTISRSERRDAHGPMRLFDHDEPHILSLALSQKLGRGWTLGGRFRLISGDPTTSVVGSVYDARSGVYIARYGPVNGERDPAFQQLDLRVEKKWNIGRGSVSLYLDVLNAYNAKNPQGYRYSYDYSRREPVRGLGVFPNLGLKGEL